MNQIQLRNFNAAQVIPRAERGREVSEQDAAILIQKVVRGYLVRNNSLLQALKRQGGVCPITRGGLTMYNATETSCGHAFDKCSFFF